ncbi:P-loop NTPase fold protein [Mycobacterium sp. SMC-15]|uniref:KAP family P-loop NTPase fold protein n=1 Tax=Mycobacterium sp. SMC-15 TaxID=3381627 RepID=UPI0038778AFD
MANRIAAAGDRNSIVYGLAGPWGGGKSSVLNMIVEALTLTHKDAWNVVRFTPWSAADSVAITDEFYRAIAEAMPKTTKEGQKARLLLAAAPVAAAAGKAALTSLIESKLGEGAVGDTVKAGAEAFADKVGAIQGPDPDPFVLRFEKMSNAIEAVGIKVLVIVDDIDRLDTTELLSVMRAVRLLGRFKNVHYLLSYDENTVIEVLKQTELASNSSRRARHYLEKIVQYPFVLPPLDPAYLESELFEALQEVATVQQVQLRQDAQNQPGSISRIIQALPLSDPRQLTLRAIYRYASQVDILLTLVGSSEIDFEDAALITFLRLRYQSVYDEVPQWRSELTGTPVISFNSREPTRDQWLVRIAAVVDEEIEDEAERNAAAELIARLLAAMFPRLQHLGGREQGIRKHKISDADYFNRYFAYRIPANDVSDSRIRRELAVLLSTGVLPDDSIIAANVDSFLGRGLVRRKMLHHLELVKEATFERAIAAAHHLMGILDPSDLDRGGWAAFIYPLLAQAIVEAGSDENARLVVDDFVERYGVLTTANVLVCQRKGPMDDSPQERIGIASSGLRDNIVRVCELDLSTDVKSVDPDALTLLHFLFYLDLDLLHRIREFAKQLIAAGQAKPYELAGRFVQIRVWPDGSNEHAEYWKFFEEIVPMSDWEIESIPPYSHDNVVDGDTSLENRIRLAAVLMKEILSGSEDGSG